MPRNAGGPVALHHHSSDRALAVLRSGDNPHLAYTWNATLAEAVAHLLTDPPHLKCVTTTLGDKEHLEFDAVLRLARRKFRTEVQC